MKTAEKWRTVQRAENYEVSSRGRVRNVASGHTLKPFMFRGEGLSVVVFNSGKPSRLHISTLVGEAFLGARPSSAWKMQHIDGNPYNCRADNLRYVRRPHRGRLAVKIAKDGKRPRLFDSVSDAAKWLGVSRQWMHLAAKGGWRVKGYAAAFADRAETAQGVATPRTERNTKK